MKTLTAYVGSYTTPERGGTGNGINAYRVDPRTGAFTHIQHLGGLENPSFLAINRAQTHLYSVHGDRSEATAYAIDPLTGHLSVIGRQSTGGYNPIHLAFDKDERFLVVTNYGSDSSAVLPVNADGTLGPYSTLAPVKGTIGPHRVEQKNVRPHHNPLDPQGRFFYVPTKGADSVITYRLDAKRGVLVHVNEVAARPSSGPRHIDFHPRRALAYFTGYSTGAEIWVDRAGRNVYVTNRGHDSVGVFAIGSSAGTLSPRQWVPTHGDTPRFFCFDPAQRFLYVANQGGHAILAYKVGSDGKLSPTRIKVKVGSPACIVFSATGGPV
ncbi:MAG: lactonase family protein [Alphaproteobacteria bacterium]|nr:lactonase family protein [Alphaproteobacteria bacterium]